MGYVKNHPIVAEKDCRLVSFFFNGRQLQGREGEPVTSALVSNGIWTFSKHYKDKAPQSLFCANGQCSKCMLIVDGEPKKGCVTALEEGMRVEPLEELIVPPESGSRKKYESINDIETDVLIVGAGPAGLSAASVLTKAGASVTIVDDKDCVGGKLVLQTHNFFGSVADCYAGTRGIDIATKLHQELIDNSNVNIMLKTVAIGVFSDGIVGIVEDGKRYHRVKPRLLMVATGARENTLPLEGFDLPGVFGAGAFQTLVNRDMVSCSDRLFIVGGGNVGLIAAYHALQAGMNVVGLCEAMPHFGGYQVHADKIARLGVPLFLSHGAVCAHGDEKVESVTITKLDNNFQALMGTERSFPVDAVLVAVGLNPINELVTQAQEAEMPVLSAGDAQEIAEASAAMFSGKLTGIEALKTLGLDLPADLQAQIGDWPELMKTLRAKPGEKLPAEPTPNADLYPVLFCHQEIPCDPCQAACPKGSIKLSGRTGSILDTPTFAGDCTGCAKCVVACPALAITLVDKRKQADEGFVRVTVPYEMADSPEEGSEVVLTDEIGTPVGIGKVLKVSNKKWQDRRKLVTLATNSDVADRVAGIRIQNPETILQEIEPAILPERTANDAIVCLCERVTAGEIREGIRKGLTNLNMLKSIRVGMGSCGGTTCGINVRRILREEGYTSTLDSETRPRPLVFETPLGVFAADDSEKEHGD